MIGCCALLTGIAALSVLSASAARATGPDNCAVVVKIRDGFLNVRAAPTMKSKIIARVNPADIVHDDAYESDELEGSYYEGWTHIDRGFSDLAVIKNGRNCCEDGSARDF